MPVFSLFSSLTTLSVEDPFSVLSVLVPEPLSRPQLTPLQLSQSRYQHSPQGHPAPIAISLKRSIDHLQTPTSTPVTRNPKRRKHWVITRNAPSRAKVRDEAETTSLSGPNETREPLPTDWGPSALLDEEVPRGRSKDDFLDAIRVSLDSHSIPKSDTEEYWNVIRAKEGEGFIRDVVYGGVDGLAYVRSLAEFVDTDPVCTVLIIFLPTLMVCIR
jgi:bromodomain-containing protein 7/9